MFKRKLRASTEGAQSYQNRADQVTEASDFIQDQLLGLAAEGTHPWHAPDAMHLQWAFATTAFAYDHTSELLLEEGEYAKRNGEKVASPDIAIFAEAMSASALQHFETAKGFIENPTDAVFDEENIMLLHPANMPSYWPRAYAEGVSDNDWQSPEMPEVSQEFIRGVIRAGFDFQAHAAADVRQFAETLQAPVPPEFESLYPLIMEILDSGQEDLDAAQGIIYSGEDMTPDAKEQALRLTYEGYVKMLHALLASKTPQVLGSEFLPIRN